MIFRLGNVCGESTFGCPGAFFRGGFSASKLGVFHPVYIWIF